VRKGRQADASGWNWRMTGLAVFAVAAVAQLGISGAYHTLQPGLTPRLVMQRIDHIAIFVLIADTPEPNRWVMALTGSLNPGMEIAGISL